MVLTAYNITRKVNKDSSFSAIITLNGSSNEDESFHWQIVTPPVNGGTLSDPDNFDIQVSAGDDLSFNRVEYTYSESSFVYDNFTFKLVGSNQNFSQETTVNIVFESDEVTTNAIINNIPEGVDVTNEETNQAVNDIAFQIVEIRNVESNSELDETDVNTVVSHAVTEIISDLITIQQNTDNDTESNVKYATQSVVQQSLLESGVSEVVLEQSDIQSFVNSIVASSNNTSLAPAQQSAISYLTMMVGIVVPEEEDTDAYYRTNPIEIDVNNDIVEKGLAYAMTLPGSYIKLINGTESRLLKYVIEDAQRKYVDQDTNQEFFVGSKIAVGTKNVELSIVGSAGFTSGSVVSVPQTFFVRANRTTRFVLTRYTTGNMEGVTFEGPTTDLGGDARIEGNYLYYKPAISQGVEVITYTVNNNDEIDTNTITVTVKPGLNDHKGAISMVGMPARLRREIYRRAD